MKTVSLNGQWDFVADLDPKYHLETRVYARPEYSRPDANRRHWQRVQVPGVWQKYGERYDLYEGVCWFAREFTVDSFPEDSEARLRFGAVNYQCRVFVNGTEIGAHEGGYTEFVLDATDAIHEGENHLAVMVDSRATTIKWPPCLGYFNYGGIHRDVALEILDGPSLDNVRILAEPHEIGGMLTVSATVARPDHHLKVCVESGGLSWEELVPEDGAVSFKVPFHEAELWSPESPVLHPLRVSLLRWQTVIDTRELPCGFREVRVKDGHFQLNGAPLDLRGICYVYDSPVHGLVMDREQIQADVALMKEMGCNAVRCHYPMDRGFYEACDRAGLLVWIEPPVYCLHPGDDEEDTPFGDPEWQALAVRMIREMVASAQNHPSVAIYGIGNECNTLNQEAEAFFRTLAATVRESDPTRPVSYAALYGNVGPLADIVDLLGINSYWGWYNKVFQRKGPESRLPRPGSGGTAECEPIDLSPMREMIDGVLAQNRKAALLLTEFGADSVPGFYSNSRDLWSENYHADLLTEIFALKDDYPSIVGTFPFGLTDYRDPSKVPNGYWNELNLKGVVTYERRKKMAFDAIRARYHTPGTGPEATTNLSQTL